MTKKEENFKSIYVYILISYLITRFGSDALYKNYPKAEKTSRSDSKVLYTKSYYLRLKFLASQNILQIIKKCALSSKLM